MAEGDFRLLRFRTVTLTGGTSTVIARRGGGRLLAGGTDGHGSAIGDDYEAPSGKLTIGSPLTSGQIAIKTLEDDVLDQGETLEVQLDSATSAGTVNVSDAAAETRIVDSSEVTMSVKAAEVVEDDPNTPEDESVDTSVVEEGETATFVVELSGAVSVAVSVPYETSDGTAQAGADKDYTDNSGTLNFAPSDTSKTIEIATRNDELSEAAETFELRLTATTLPDGVSVAKASATGTITDNDTLTAAVTADAETVTEDESATFTVKLTGTSTAEVVVDYSLVGTATEDEDYTAPSDKLTIGAGLGSGQIAIKTRQDNVLDRGEKLEVRLDKATTDGAATVSTATAETTITDPGTVQVSVTGLTVEEGEPPVTVDKSSVEEGESASFVVALSGAVQETVEVSYATSAGSGSDAATAGTDYTAADVTLTFASKETSKTVAVTTTVDAFNEADETFTVTPDGCDSAGRGKPGRGRHHRHGNDRERRRVDGEGNGERGERSGRQRGGVHGRADRRHQHRGRHSELHVGGQHGHGRHRLHRTERPADDHEARFERHDRDRHQGRRCPGSRRDAVRHSDRRDYGHRDRDPRHSENGDHHHRGERHRNRVSAEGRGAGRRHDTERKRVPRQVDRGGRRGGELRGGTVRSGGECGRSGVCNLERDGRGATPLQGRTTPLRTAHSLSTPSSPLPRPSRCQPPTTTTT